MYLSIIIPAYNEEKRLPKTLIEINNYLSKQDYHYEIIVVNDGSKDQTAQETKKVMSVVKNLKLIDNKKNQGKGAVVKQGMLAAQGDYRLFTDADNSTSIDQLEKVLPWFNKGFDLVIGSRDVKGAVLDPPQPWLRNAVLGRGFRLYRKLIVGLWQIQDTQCGFKCISSKAAQDVFPKCLIDRFAFDPEILILAQKKNYQIKEIPIHWKNDLESKVNFKSMVKMAIDMVQIRINLIKSRY